MNGARVRRLRQRASVRGIVENNGEWLEKLLVVSYRDVRASGTKLVEIIWTDADVAIRDLVLVADGDVRVHN